MNAARLRRTAVAVVTGALAAGSLAAGAAAGPATATTTPPSDTAASDDAPSDTTADDDAGATDGERTVAIAAGDHDIPGTLTLPAGAGDGEALPAVLLLHGFASQRHEVGDLYARQAAALADRGVASLRIDFAGAGESSQPFTEFTWTGSVADAVAAYDWLAEQPEIDADRIGVLGFSNGAKVGLQVVVERPEAAVFASWSGALYDGLTDDNAELAAAAAADGTVSNDLGFTVVEMSNEYFVSTAASSPVADAVAAGFDRPLLVVIGAADVVVDPAVGRDFAALVAVDDATVVEIDDADHIFNVLTDSTEAVDELLPTTADWFADRLAA